MSCLFAGHNPNNPTIQMMIPPAIYKSFILLVLALYFLPPSTRILLFPVNLMGILPFAFGAHIVVSSKKVGQRTEHRQRGRTSCNRTSGKRGSG
jgi:hypothetical protein